MLPKISALKLVTAIATIGARKAEKEKLLPWKRMKDGRVSIPAARIAREAQVTHPDIVGGIVFEPFNDGWKICIRPRQEVVDWAREHAPWNSHEDGPFFDRVGANCCGLHAVLTFEQYQGAFRHGIQSVRDEIAGVDIKAGNRRLGRFARQLSKAS